MKAGKILINGQDINYFSKESLRDRITIVPQQLNLFSGNIIENIALGDFNPDMERILAILNELGLMPFIEKLPDGLSTFVGENGASLSGGEKQRIAIARALYKKPDIIILDEATSSLDSESEFYVKKAITKLNEAKKTVLVIAHRLSTVVDADKIVILENGTIVEEGTHNNLYIPGTRYYDLWKKQLPENRKRVARVRK